MILSTRGYLFGRDQGVIVGKTTSKDDLDDPLSSHFSILPNHSLDPVLITLLYILFGGKIHLDLTRLPPFDIPAIRSIQLRLLPA